MSWSNLKDNMPPSGSGNLLKLEDSKPIKIRVVGEPYVFATEYKGQPSTRFAIKLWNQSDNAAQFLMLPKTPLNHLLDLAANPDWGDPTEYDVTITRRGTGKDTEYSIQPSPNKSHLNPAKKKEVQAIDLQAVLERFPSISTVMPLAEADEGFWKKNSAQTEAQVDSEPLPPAPDEVHSLPDDEEINLSDIPF